MNSATPTRTAERRAALRHVHDPLPRHPAACARPAARCALPGSKSISNRVLLLAALRRRHDHASHDLLDSDDTRVMLDALRAARLRHRARAATRCASPASAAGCRRRRRDAVPRQRRHGDAAADRGAGPARRRLRAARRAAHARAADRRPGRRAASARLRASSTSATPGFPPLRIHAAAGAARRSTRRSACAATSRASS